MTTKEIANRLAELCRIGKYDQVYEELFDTENIVSIEPEYTQQPPAKGIAAIKKKGEQFNEMVKEIHNSYVSEPLVAGNIFTLTMGMDYTDKEGKRSDMEEVCVYEVKDGKIVKEQFFF